MATPENILEGYVKEADFARQVGKSLRTITRMRNEPNGLPYVKFGCTVYVHIPSAKEWLASRLKRRNPPRARSRKPRHEARVAA
jgi:hypothetical protein